MELSQFQLYGIAIVSSSLSLSLPYLQYDVCWLYW